MSQTHCPRCGDLLRFPADLPSEAIVRCPLCTEQFTFSEMAASLPPMLEIVSLPESAPDLEGINRLDELLSAKPAATTPNLVSAPMVSTGRSGVRRRPAESPWRPLILLIEVALSGVVGIALAILVLWWLPGQWHRDPLTLKPVAAKYAPWLLPPAHRPMTELLPTVEESQPKTTTRASSKSDAKNRFSAQPATKPTTASKPEPKTKPQVDEGPAPPKKSEKLGAKNENIEPTIINETKSNKPAISEEPALETGKEPIAEPARNQEPTNKEKEPTFAEQLSKLSDPPPEPPELTWTGSPEISALVRQAERRRKEPPSPIPDFLGRLEPDFVKTFHELARVAGQVNTEDVGLEVARARLKAWLATLTNEDWKKACEATANDLKTPTQAPRGVIYLAKLKAAQAEGSWLHLEIEPAPGEPTFPILIDPKLFHESAGDSFIGKEIYLLGSELPDPKRLVTDVPSGIKKTWLIGAIHGG